MRRRDRQSAGGYRQADRLHQAEKGRQRSDGADPQDTAPRAEKPVEREYRPLVRRSVHQAHHGAYREPRSPRKPSKNAA